MLFRKISIVFLSMIILSSVGCRIIHRYEFESDTVNISDGELIVNFEGNYGDNYEQNGVKRADWGFPYSLQYIYVVPDDKPLYKVIIKDICLTGEETKTRFNLPNAESSKIRILKKENELSTIVRGGVITSDTYEYEPYLLEMTVVIFADANTSVEERLVISIKTKRTIERRSDWFDEIMSV